MLAPGRGPAGEPGECACGKIRGLTARWSRRAERPDRPLRRMPMMDPIRRKILKTGAAATVVAAAPRVFARQKGQGGAAVSFYEKGRVRIYYEEAGSGFPLLLIAGGGLNSTISGLANPFNPIDEFKGEYRCIASDLRNATGGQSSGPLEIDRPCRCDGSFGHSEVHGDGLLHWRPLHLEPPAARA